MTGGDGGLAFFHTDFFTRVRMKGDFGGGIMMRVH